MFNIVTVIILLILVYVVFLLRSGRDGVVRREAYQWWFMPWFALLFAGLMYLLYNKTNFPSWPLIRNIYEEYKVEGLFFVLCAAIWTAAEYFLLRNEDIHEALIGPFRKMFAGNSKDADKVLPFPYFLDREKNVHSRVGQVFYRWTIKCFILLLSLAYVVFFILASYAHKDFFPKSGLGLLGLIPLIDYYIYLCAQAPVEESIRKEKKEKKRSNFDELWEDYVGTFGDYTLAWKRTRTDRMLTDDKQDRIDNKSNLDELFKEFTEKHTDVLIQNWDLTSAIFNLGRFFSYVEKNGRNVLVLVDVPNHSVTSGEQSYFDEIAEMLRKVLKKEFYVFDGESALEDLNNSVVLAPLSSVSSQNLQSEWIEKIGLITVVNLFDKSVSNLYESMRFSYVLQSLNPDYQIIFVTPFLLGSQPALESVWKRKEKAGSTVEKRKKLSPSGPRQFFIGYNYEDFRNRLPCVFIGRTAETLFSGTELTLIALSYRFMDCEKVVTPVHFLELPYTSTIEGVEELDKYSGQQRKEVLCFSSDDLNKNVLHHHLPLTGPMTEEQIFAILYDQENNAPAVYTKWQHLGNEENFSIMVSKPYLFRDYFYANMDYFQKAPFVAIQPSPSQSRVVLANVLLRKLKNARISEEELRNLLSCYYSMKEIQSVSSIIKDLFSTYFSKDLSKNLTSEEVVRFDGMAYSHHIEYELRIDNDHDQDYLNTVTVREKNTKNQLLVILRDLMEQNFAIGQVHSFAGRPYEIFEYNESTRTLLVTRKNKDVLFYKPCLSVSIGSKRSPIKGLNSIIRGPIKWNHPLTGEPISIEFEGFETDVTINTLKWLEFKKYSVFGYEESNTNQKPRRYRNGKVLKVSFRFLRKPEYLESIDNIRKSLQILLYEAMQSLFPHHAQYLIISSTGDTDRDLPWIFNRLIVEEQPDYGVLEYYFTEDAHIDLGLIGALSNKEAILYILGSIFDYLIWLCEGNGDSPTGYDAYRHGEHPDKLAFLKYGRNSLPDYFDIDLMINFIKDLFKDNDTLWGNVRTRQDEQDFIGTCDFCRKQMKNSEMQRLDDGRMRCPDCSKDAVDSEAQFKELCDRVKKAFLQHLNIDFSTIPHQACLVSAVELHKLAGKPFSITNGYDIRKLIGMARNSTEDKFYVENGHKTLDTFGTIAHEMTHIWEYNDPDFIKVRKTNEDLVEGLAVWTDLFLSEKEGATDIEERRAFWEARTDEYGRGLRFILDHCPDDPYEYIRTEATKL